MIKSKCFRLRSYTTLTTALLTAAVLFCFTACNLFYDKETYLKDFKKFVTQTEIDYVNYSQTEWEKTDEEYDKFNEELYQHVYNDLTPEDQQTIGKLKARYQSIKLKYELNNTIQSIKDGVEQVVGGAKEIVGGN